MSSIDHLDDEQLTALSDGDGAPGERAHLETCERCRSRAEALDAVAALVAAPLPPPSDAAREAVVAAAVAEAERPVVAPRARRPRRRVPGWLAPVAAVVVLLALVAAVIPLLARGDSDDADSAAPDRSATAESGDTGGGGGSASGPSTLHSAAPAGDLGAVDDEAELARRVDDALTAESAADAAEAPVRDEDPCVASFRALEPPLGSLRLRASLVWQGQPAQVVSDGERAVVVASGSCTTLATVPLP